MGLGATIDPSRLPHFELHDQGHGPHVMFLHGFPEAAFVWDELLEHFAQPEHGGCRCIAPNLRGFERSSQPAEVSAYRPKYIVQDIAALIASGGGPLASPLGFARSSRPRRVQPRPLL